MISGEGGIFEILFKPTMAEVEESIAMHVADAVPVHGGEAEIACRELEEFFVGKRKEFSLRLDWRGMTRFQENILKSLSTVPFGKTITYGELAKRSGYQGAARAVGGVMAANPFPIVVPCHRVVGGRGLTGYSGGQGIISKQWLLDFEMEHVPQ